MEASTVYYTDFRCPVGTSLTEKLRRLCIAAGIKNIDMEGRFVAIKMHFGELGNLAYLRPNYAKVVADLCKEQGGMPFLTDCNTLYPGSRKNALEHLTCAQLNGFWPMTTGCQVIIADGLRGAAGGALAADAGRLRSRRACVGGVAVCCIGAACQQAAQQSSTHKERKDALLSHRGCPPSICARPAGRGKYLSETSILFCRAVVNRPCHEQILRGRAVGPD